MIRVIFISIFCILLSFQLFGQLPIADFNMPAEVCLEEQFLLENTSTNAVNYDWDFCSYDNLQFVPQAQALESNNYGSPFHIKILENNGLFYGFVTGRTTNKIYRLDFGENPKNTPIYNDLGGISILNNPSGIDIKKIGENWYGLVTGYASNKLYLLEFGTSLEATPNITDISNSLNLNLPMDVKIVVDSDNIFAFIINNASGEYPYLRLNFGTDITSAPLIDEFVVSGANTLTSIDIKKENNDWYGFLVSRSNQRLYRVNFGTSISNSPTYTDVSTPAGISMNDPGGLKMVKEIDSAYVFVQSRNGPLYKFHFGDDFNNTASASDLGNIYSDNRNWGLDFIKVNSKWIGFNANFGNKIYRIDFPSDCNLESPVSSLESPLLSISQSGQTLISLTALNSDGNYSNITKELTISSNEAPSGGIFLEPAYCIADNITFSFNTTDDISSYNWDFGDSNSSTDISPTHQYATDGEFFISLEIESAAGCPNIFYDTIAILPEPQTEFTTTSTEYCTFEAIDFNNITPFDYGENIQWSWDFNGEGSSTVENPSFTFESSGTKTITLEANVLGCVETYQASLNIIDGPQPDFEFDKNCIGEVIQFNNLSTGANITGYEWDFGNGETSTEEDPQVTYNNAGDFTVELRVRNASGCENTTTQSIQIFEQVVDSIHSTDAIENLPFDLGIDWNNDFDSTQNLSFSWDINGDIQTTDTATYTLTQGNYTVNLEVTTDNNCLFNAQRSIEIKASESPIPDFNLPSEICLEEQFELENTSVNIANVEWDFCINDLKELPKNGIELIDFDINNSIAFRLLNSGNNYFGFSFDRNSDEFYRLDFGDNPSSIPTINNLGNIDGLFNGPVAIDFIKENDDWFGLVANTDSNDIIKLSFGSSLSNTPTAVSLTNFGTINNPEGIMISQHSDTILAFVMNGTKITRLNFGSSINNVAKATNISVPNSNRLWGLDIIKDSGDYVGVLSSFGNSNVYYLEFGADLLSPPNIQQFDVSSLNLISPAGLQLIKSDENYYSFIQYRSGDLIRFSFGETMNLSPLMENLGTVDIIPTTNNSYVQLIKDSSKWVGYTMNFGQSKLFKYEFENICSASSSFSQILSPQLNFSQPGTYPITLTAYHPNGNSASITKEITVTENQAPEIAFTTGEDLCVSAPIQFSNESNEAISTYSWDFGDGNLSTEANPAHLFSSAGEYLVQLSVTDTAGCNNLFQDSITIYAEPVPDFQASAQGSICSQKPVIFENITTLPTTATFQWDFGDGTTSTEENPEHIYASEGEYIIHFQIEMAGCLVEKTDTITVNPGPLVDFNYNDDCFGQVVNFENSSTGEFLQSFQWNFGDGTQSTQLNPNHSYDSAGTYQVALTALTSNGCDYTFQKAVIVHPVATVAFVAEVGCANQPLQFNEQVALQQSNITDYLWDFGVSGTTSDVSTEANPEFTFPSAGTYEVSLQVTTADGCTTSGTQTVSVNALPQPAFRYEDNCLNNAILFSPENTENIVAHFWELKNAVGDVVFTAQSENFSYAFENAGTYQLRYRQQNENLCSNSITETIEILPLPDPDFQVGSICSNEPIFFENLTDLKGNTVKSYSWSINEAVVSTDFRPQYTFEESGDYQIALQVETQNGCIQTVEKTISVSPAPVAFFELEQSLAAFPYTLTLSAQSQGQTAVRPAKHNTDTNLITIKSKNSTRRTIPTSPLGTEGLSNFQLPTSNQLTIDNKQLTNRTSQLLSDTILSPFISTYFNNISTKSSAYKHTISSNTQHPTPNTLLPTPNTQHPSSNITWTLNGDTISSSAQLNYVITQPGTYLLGLILTNEAGCADSHFEQIRIRKPNLDIALSNLRITQDQDFTGFVLNISNRGTLVPERLDLEIDLGSYAVTETIEEPLLPEQNRNVALGIKLTEEQIRGLAKICIRAIPHNGVANETYENNNRVCTNIETGLTIMEIYPNPVVTQFTLPIILPENAVLSLSLEQSNGHNVEAYSYDLEAGYHEIQLERGNIKPGIYFLRIRYQGKETVKKIIFQ